MQTEEIAYTISLIFYYTSKHTIEGAGKAEELLERLIAEGRDGGNGAAHIEAKIYNAVIDGYAKSKSQDGPIKAESVLNRMVDRYETNIADKNDEWMPAEPDITAYNSLMNAWCQSTRKDAVSKAEAIMSKLESDEVHLDPNGITYNIMMNTYANQVGEYGYAQKAEDILLLMSALQKDGTKGISLDTLSFNIVLKAWKNSGGGVESARRAEDILRLMMKLYADGHVDVKPDIISFQTTIHAYTKPHEEERGLSAEVIDHLEGIASLLVKDTSDLASTNGIVYRTCNTVIDYIGKSGLDDAGDRADRVLDVLIGASGRTNDAPDISTYTHVMNAYLANEKTAHKAHAMATELIAGNAPVLPNTFCLNSILHFHCKNNDVASAEQLFQTMINVADEKGYRTRPDVATFNMMANMYFHDKRKDSAEQIFQILERMEQAHDTGTLNQLDPFIYNVVVNKLSKSKMAESGSKAYGVLMRMVNRFDSGELQNQPDTIGESTRCM